MATTAADPVFVDTNVLFFANTATAPLHATAQVRLQSYEEKDEYSDVYEVYLLPFRSKDDSEAHPDFWMHLASAVHLGQIPVIGIGLDETRRRSIDARAIET